MNKDVKEKWLAALRSGKYKQATGTLRSPDGGFCCLGVLCDVARIEGVIPNPVKYVDAYYYGKGPVHGDERNSATLPSPVRQWAGLSPNPIFKMEKDVTVTASWANDSQHKSFEEIADLIEKHL